MRQLVGAGAVFFVVLIAGFATVLRVDGYELDDSEANVVRLKEGYVSRTRVVANLAYHEQQFREVRQLVDGVVEMLPSSFDPSIAAMRRVAEETGLRMESLDPEPGERLREFYAERAVRVEVSGRYHDLGEFMARLSSIPGTVRLESFVIERSTSAKLVVLKGTLRTYRYLEDDELIAMRRRAAERSQ